MPKLEFDIGELNEVSIIAKNTLKMGVSDDYNFTSKTNNLSFLK